LHPILWRFGPDFLGISGWSPAIHTFGPLVALGCFLGILLMRREGIRRGFDPEVITGLCVETLLAGVAGSRVLFILITPDAFRHDPNNSFIYNWVIQYLALWNGGLVWYGGFLPAAIFGAWRANKLGLPWRTILDMTVPYVIFGLAVGRIGCLMAGDDHGKLVESGPHWWTLTFHAAANREDNPLLSDPNLFEKPLWPAQPLMGIGALTIAVIGHSLRKKLQARPLATALVVLTLYPIHRFFIEMIRGDTIRKFVYVTQTDASGMAIDGLSTSQAISIPLALIALTLLVMKLVKPPAGIELASPAVAYRPEGAAAAPAPVSVPAPAPVAPAPPEATATSPEKKTA
jgi:phosphatidylglycerol:prolipoprotein diacylglycerol transferase